MQSDPFYNAIYDMVELYRHNRKVFFYTTDKNIYNFNFGSLPHHQQHDILMLALIYSDDIDVDEVFKGSFYSYHDFIKLAYDEGSHFNPVQYAAMTEKVKDELMPIILEAVGEVVQEQENEEESLHDELALELHMTNQERILSIREQL